MKKITFSTVFVLVFIMYAMYQSFGNSSTLAYVAPSTSTVQTSQPIVPAKKKMTQTRSYQPIQIPAPTSNQTAVSNSQPLPKASAPTPTPTPTPAPVPNPTPQPVVKKGLYNDGTYTGDVADAYYGNIQVAVVITNGKISDVQFLQYPSDRSHSISINQYAMPILRSEAISAQSANVDIVSGATDSSQAFQQSLGSVLTQAKA